jgi:hypothetical protein
MSERKTTFKSGPKAKVGAGEGGCSDDDDADESGDGEDEDDGSDGFKNADSDTDWNAGGGGFEYNGSGNDDDDDDGSPFRARSCSLSYTLCGADMGGNVCDSASSSSSIDTIPSELSASSLWPPSPPLTKQEDKRRARTPLAEATILSTPEGKVSETMRLTRGK